MQPKDSEARHNIVRLQNAGTYSQTIAVMGKSKLTVQRVKAARDDKTLAY